MNLKFWKKSDDLILHMAVLENVYFVLYKVDPPEKAIGYAQAYLWKKMGGRLKGRMLEDYNGFMRTIRVSNDS